MQTRELRYKTNHRVSPLGDRDPRNQQPQFMPLTPVPPQHGIPAVNPRLHLLGSLATMRVTAEHYHPNEPLSQTYGGVGYWLGSATYIFIDGRQVLRSVLHGNPSETYNQVLLRTCAAVRSLPSLKISDLTEASGEWPAPFASPNRKPVS